MALQEKKIMPPPWLAHREIEIRQVFLIISPLNL